MYGISPTWLTIMIVSVVLGYITRGYINSSFRKWSQVALASGLTGAQVAARVLEYNGINSGGVAINAAVPKPGAPSVSIRPIGGALSDNYDPRDKTLNLSEAVYAVSSVAAAGVAAHEAGHAVQDAQGYFWGRLRSALVPVASIGSNAAIFLIFGGVMLQVFLRAAGVGELAYYVVMLGVVLYAFAVLFQVVTLPVELDASHRALAALEGSGVLDASQIGGARQVLTAAALTYVAAALIALMQLFYFLGFLRRD
jgi:Zn-dependent membrane protease YugP